MADGTIGLWTVPLAVFGGAIRVSTPFLFVSLGECITERSGRINLGLEGTLVMGAMSAYGISYLSGSPWLGVLAAGITGALFGALHAGICSLPRVNDIAVGIALMLFGTGLAFYLGKPLIEPTAAALAGDRFRLVERHSPGPRGVADQRAVPDWRRHRADPVLGVPDHALGPVDPHRRRKFGCGARDGLFRALDPPARHHGRRLSRRHRRLVPVAVLSRQLERGPLQRAGHHRGSAGDLARWDPMLCLWASLAFGGAAALGPALQSVGVTSGYHLFNAAPYILTLAIMIITCSPKRTLTGAPAELSITR